MTTTPRRVSYVHSAELARVGDALPSNLGRASLVHALISSYGLLDGDRDNDAELTGDGTRASVVPPVAATRQELMTFHDGEFIAGVDSLLGSETSSPSSSASESDSDSSTSSESPRRKRRKTRHDASSLVDDCPPFPLLSRYVPLVAGASLTGARQLRDGLADVAISWTGGRHHASRGEAKGFCYIIDIVLSIMELRKKPLAPGRHKLNKVLYLDLDLHHGDAVESAFASSPYILTLSLHLHAPLFYPATGSLNSSGPTNVKAAGRGHALNLALESGLAGESLKRVWETVERVKSSFAPDAVVVQCGVDGLNGDPCKEWNLSLSDYGHCVSAILDWNVPTLLLGGGGYSSPNAARTWTYLTSLCLNRPSPSPSTCQIPSSLAPEEYEQFSPSFTLDVEASETIRDKNNDLTLSRVETAFEGYCRHLNERWGTPPTHAESLKRQREAVEAPPKGEEAAASGGKPRKTVRFDLDDAQERATGVP
ncbi:hypothetical protein JCM11491_005350 [Sporobolomyces phaffii]